MKASASTAPVRNIYSLNSILFGIIFPLLFDNHFVTGVASPTNPRAIQQGFAFVPCIMATGAWLVGPCVILGQALCLDDVQNGHGMVFHRRPRIITILWSPSSKNCLPVSWA